MSTSCQRKAEVRTRRGRVVDLEGARLHRLALVIIDELRAGQGSVCHDTAAVHDVDLWRRAARRAGRLLGIPIRTGVAPDGSAVWACEGP